MTTNEQGMQTQTLFSMPLLDLTIAEHISQTQIEYSMPLKIWQEMKKWRNHSNSKFNATQDLTNKWKNKSNSNSILSATQHLTTNKEITQIQYSMPLNIWQQLNKKFKLKLNIQCYSRFDNKKKEEITQTQNSMPLKIWQTNEKINQNSNSILSATQHLTTVEQVI